MAASTPQMPWSLGSPAAPGPPGAQRGSLGDPVQCPPCPSQGCLDEHHLHSRASLAPTETRSCVTMTNRTGFLCHDRRQCIPAHGVCDGIRTCAHGEDEEESLCREYPSDPCPCSFPYNRLNSPCSSALWNILRHCLHAPMPTVT